MDEDKSDTKRRYRTQAVWDRQDRGFTDGFLTPAYARLAGAEGARGRADRRTGKRRRLDVRDWQAGAHPVRLGAAIGGELARQSEANCVGRPSAKQRKPYNSDAILDVAVRVFRLRGYDGSSLYLSTSSNEGDRDERI